MTLVVAILSILHGLTHLWYVTLSMRWVEFTPAMGWTGESWLFSNLLSESAARSIAVILYSVAALGFVAGGVGLLSDQAWFRPLFVSGSIVSMAAILLYWDGAASKLVEKGLIGLLLSLAFLLMVGLLRWPASLG